MSSQNEDIALQAQQELETTLRRTVNVGIKVTRTIVNKTNGPKEALVAQFPDSNISPTIYLDGIYKRYQNGESIKGIASDLAETIKEAYSNHPEFDTDSLTVENARDHITLSVINTEKNQELLSKTPNYSIGDVSVIPRWQISEDASFVVSNDIASSMGLTPEEVLSIGQQNINKTEFSVKTMRETLLEMFSKDGMDADMADLLMPPGEGDEMIILSTEDKFQGAKGILSKDALKTVSEKFGGKNFFVLPSSIHEVICVPDNGTLTPAALRDMVKSVNATELDPRDFLSNNIFKFDGTKIKMVLDAIKMDPVGAVKHTAEEIAKNVIKHSAIETTKIAMKM